MTKCFMVGLGGFIGTACRYLLGLMLSGVTAAFPASTLIINILGSFALGAITEFSCRVFPLHPLFLLFLTVGLCGGFTTFSTFSLETQTLMEKGRVLAGTGYAVSSLLLCLAGVWAGKTVMRLL